MFDDNVGASVVDDGHLHCVAVVETVFITGGGDPGSIGVGPVGQLVFVSTAAEAEEVKDVEVVCAVYLENNIDTCKHD